MAAKSIRVEVANELIKLISDHGRRFFYNKTHDRVARFELDQQGRVWFRDDYTGKAIYTHYEGRWRGFSHGGTLKQLVEKMRDYIRFGVGKPGVCDHRIPLGFIAPTRASCGGNVWGYCEEAAADVREAASKLHIIKRPEESSHDHT